MNLVVFSIIVFSIQQSELLTIKRFYTILTVVAAFLMSGILFKLPFTYKLAKAIDKLFDPGDIILYEDSVKLIVIVTSSFLLSLFPLRLLFNYETILYLLVISTSLFLLAYSLTTIYLIISVKSPFYNCSIKESNLHPHKYYFKQETNYEIIPIKTEKLIIPNTEKHFININKEINLNKTNKEVKCAILEEIYLPSDIKNYVPLFIIIDKLYVTRDRENKRLTNELFALFSRLSGGKHDSIKTKFNELKDDNSIMDRVKLVKRALYSNGRDSIVDFEQYSRIGYALLKELNLSYFKIPINQSDEFILLCVIYFTIFINDNKSPDLSALLNKDVHKQLLHTLKKING